MNSFLKQSTASQSRAIGPFVDDTDFKTPETGLTIANTDIKLVVNGGASANKNSGGGTHRVNGVYGVTFDSTDTATVGEIEVSVVVSGALPVFHKFWVLEEAVYDMLFGASALGYIANAPVNVAQFGGSNGTFSSGRPEVNTTHAAGTAWGSGAITAASIASSAITSAKFAASAIDATAIASNALTSAKFAAGAFDAVWSVATRVLTAGTNIALAKGTGVTGFNDLDAAGIRTAVGLASANLDTQLSGKATASALATAQADLDILTGTDGVTLATSQPNYAPNTATPLDAAGVRAAVGLASANLDTQLGAINTLATTIDGKADAITTLLDTTGIVVLTNNDKTGYSIGTGGIASTSFAAGAIDAAALATDAGQELADRFLLRSIASGSDAGRTVRDAFRAIRNRVDGSTGTLTVYEEDDTTPAWTATLTRSAVDPIVEINP